MDAILGEHNSDLDFARYLANWRAVLAERVAQAIEAVGQIPEVSGLILAGSNGAGRPWPLSDIDLIPVLEEHSAASAQVMIDATRARVMASWSGNGWRTGVDIGRLYFTTSETAAIVDGSMSDPRALLADDRWYYAMDKAYLGRPSIDPDGSVALTVGWITDYRFQPEVVAFRVARCGREALASIAGSREALERGDRVHALSHLLKGVQWAQIGWMEHWGARDNSLGRFGTRFEQQAHRQEQTGLCVLLDALCGLDAKSVQERLQVAPLWVHERRRRSWDARRLVGEEMTALQNDRDTLRVSTIYALREVEGLPIPTWLQVPERVEIEERLDALDAVVQKGFGGA